MTRVETLTAYKCKFCYLHRNNPLIEEQRTAIKENREPEYTFSEFIEKYLTCTEKLTIGQHTDRAILLSSNKIQVSNETHIKRWHIIASAGKQGKPITLAERTGKKREFGADTAALYDYHIFVYEKNESLIIIFHRQNGSGCKSVFYETANKVLREIGLKFNMELIVQANDELKNATPTKIVLKQTQKYLSSDVAENINGPKKKQVILEVGINLEVIENKNISNIFDKLKEKTIDKAEVFTLIKEELDYTEEFDDAEVKIRVGKRTKSVKWNDFERIMGTHDITEKLHKAYKKTNNFEKELIKLVDEYYLSISCSEGI